MRQTKTITVPGRRSDVPGERDNGKVFIVTEMSAYDAEAWSNRAFLAIAHAGINLPDGMRDGGMPGIVGIAQMLGHVQFPELKPLLDELLGCVLIQPDPKVAFTRPLVVGQGASDDIDDPFTYQMLREEVAALHVNFTLAASILILIAKVSNLPAVSLASLGGTQMSQEPSEP